MSRGHHDTLPGLRELLVGSDPELNARVDARIDELNLAQQLDRLRSEANLTQSQLAELVGTSHSVISRLENATYEGHSLSMLRRIAQALGHRVEVRFVPLDQDAQAA
jgi:DNA-binding XRE family transcriptional regulator